MVVPYQTPHQTPEYRKHPKPPIKTPNPHQATSNTQSPNLRPHPPPSPQNEENTQQYEQEEDSDAMPAYSKSTQDLIDGYY